LLERASVRLVKHFTRIEARPSVRGGGARVARRFRESGDPFHEDGAPLENALDELFDTLVEPGLEVSSPTNFGAIPSGGLITAAIADLLASATNRFTAIAPSAPPLAELERAVVRTFASWLGMPDGAGGVLTSGGSLANLYAFVAAREANAGALERGVVYTSEEAHHSVLRGARVSGIPAERVRLLPVDASFRLVAPALARAVDDDRARGLLPFLVVANGGTTNTGAVDPLADVSAIARRERLWLHIDAAYGGFFALTARGSEALRGIHEADSVTLDPHKSLFLPFGTGALVVRDPRALERAFGMRGEYLPAASRDAYELCDLSPELSREARGLRVWLPLRVHGVARFRRALDEAHDLACEAARAIAAIEDLEVADSPALSLFAFRIRPERAVSWARAPDVDRINRLFLRALQRRGRVMLTGTRTSRGFFLRVCILSPRTKRKHIDLLLTEVRDTLATVARAMREDAT
jgi:aromatic-L-amino-acid decarboxylase